jgi:hypothetical protein
MIALLCLPLLLVFFPITFSAQGGMFPGVSDYGNYNGYNLRYVPDLHRALLHYGWTASSSGTWCGSAGQV